MKVGVCVIISVLAGFGCGSNAANQSNATGIAGMTSAVGSAGSKPVTSAAGSGGAGSGAVAPPAPSATGGRPAAGSSSPATTTIPAAGSSGGNATAGTTASTAAGATAPAPAAGSGSGGAGGSAAPATTEKFSFFVTSLEGMKTLSKSDKGFGGDLRYGQATGLAGADKICTDLAEKSMPGAGAKGWRAFLSTAKAGETGGPSHARDRVGQGPWYDRTGRLVAMTLADLIQQRPRGANSAIMNDLPNENGVPNHLDTMMGADDNHDTVTGSNMMGMYDGTPTCEDWTSIQTPGAAGSGAMSGAAGRPGGGFPGGLNLRGPRVGHSWPAQQSGMHWIMAHQAPGCAPSVALVQTGAGSGDGIGNGGGYGGFYCFALKP